MPTRYFKATDGRFTVFRGTASRIYVSAWWDDLALGKPPRGHISFAGKAGLPGWLPAEEISKAEYQALVERKAARIAARKAELVAEGKHIYRDYGSAPGDSWVKNEVEP